MNKRTRLLLIGGGSGVWNPGKPLSGSLPSLWVSADSEVYTDNGTTPAVADNLIYLWKDKSGNSHSFVQTTETNRPTLKVESGISRIRFDGNDNGMIAPINAKEAQTLFMVSKKNTDAGTTSKHFIYWGSGSYSTIYCKSNQTPPGQQWWWYANEAAAVVNLGGFVTNLSIISMTFNSTSSMTINVNGASATSLDPKNGTGSYDIATSIAIGYRGVDYTDCDFCEIIQYEAALSAADRQKVEKYLSSKYSISLG